MASPTTVKTQTYITTRENVYTCICHNVKPTPIYQVNVIDRGNECSCYAEGVLPRAAVAWTDGKTIQVSQLTELITAAKYELKIRNRTSDANNLSTRPTYDKVTIDDVNQMISRIENMRTAVQTIPTQKSVLYTDLKAMRDSLRELQTECLAYVACTCNYCYCHQDCSCNCNRCTNDATCSCDTNYCSQVGANGRITCAQVCSCYSVCSCYQDCQCYCNYCSCNYRGSCSSNSASYGCIGHHAAVGV